MGPITELLQRWRYGEDSALDDLMPLVYEELRRLARSRLRAERSDHTLQPTALVHEAYVRLLNAERPSWRSRAHFFAVAALVMRRVLIDHARTRGRQRRGSGAVHVDLDPARVAGFEAPTVDLLALDQVLKRLDARDPRKAQVVQMRFFGGLTLDEVAEVLDISQVTVVRDWRLARAWLLREFGSPS
ncbi:MAG: sigma-70 family RNA polymerase sigma factor [Acidobacteriota bacterium]